jgi:N-acetylmuramoyl-L-alanine amidase
MARGAGQERKGARERRSARHDCRVSGRARRLALISFLAPMLLMPGALPSAWGQAAGQAARTPSGPVCDRAAFRVVVDVGHTNESPGAWSARGVTEYEFNLRLAEWIERKLIARGFNKTMLLITDGPGREGLVKRVAVANNSRADLFLSVHHDSVPEHLKAKWEHEGDERKFSDRFPGHSIFISNDNAERQASLMFGKLLGAQLKARGLQYTPHYTEAFMRNRRRELVDATIGVYRYDKLVVLRKTHMPSVLLEAGSIVNREEELALVTPERRGLVAAAVAEAVEQFCASRRPLDPELVARRAPAR